MTTWWNTLVCVHPLSSLGSPEFRVRTDVYQEDEGAFVQEIQVIFSSIRFSCTHENNLLSVLKLFYVQPRRMGGGGQFAAGVYIPAASSICGFFKHGISPYQAVSRCV